MQLLSTEDAYGVANEADWSTLHSRRCQPILLLVGEEGFESGDTTGWNSSTPYTNSASVRISTKAGPSWAKAADRVSSS